DIKGSAAYFNRSDSRSATPLLVKRAGTDKPTRKYDRVTGSISGPIYRDHTFFMLAFEHLKDIQPEAAYYTVPTEKMRKGDFSEFSSIIYDPLTASGSSNTRKAFNGNLIPDQRINNVARAYAALYPLPNRPGTVSNYFTNQLRPYTYNGFVTRIDHSLNESNRLFGNAYWNKRQEDRYNWALGATNATGKGEINGFLVTAGYDYRRNTGATLSYTSMLVSKLAPEVRGVWSRFGEWRDNADTFDPASLGFSAAAAQLMKGYSYLPFVTFGGFSTTNSNSTIASLGSQRSDWGTGFNRPFTNISFIPNADWLWGEHAMKAGYELRNQRWNITNAAYAAGRFFFNGAYTRLNNSAPLNDRAQEWAQFLLGLPTAQTGTVANAGSNASQFEIAANGDWRQIEHALFMQDDWHVNNRLTLNLGLRLELEQA